MLPGGWLLTAPVLLCPCVDWHYQLLRHPRLSCHASSPPYLSAAEVPPDADVLQAAPQKHLHCKAAAGNDESQQVLTAGLHLAPTSAATTQLTVEAIAQMGELRCRHSNLVLTHGSGEIMACAHQVGSQQSSLRQLHPGRRCLPSGLTGLAVQSEGPTYSQAAWQLLRLPTPASAEGWLLPMASAVVPRAGTTSGAYAHPSGCQSPLAACHIL